jgi:hypothetical protein
LRLRLPKYWGETQTCVKRGQYKHRPFALGSRNLREADFTLVISATDGTKCPAIDASPIAVTRFLVPLLTSVDHAKGEHMVIKFLAIAAILLFFIRIIALLRSWSTPISGRVTAAVFFAGTFAGALWGIRALTLASYA